MNEEFEAWWHAQGYDQFEYAGHKNGVKEIARLAFEAGVTSALPAVNTFDEPMPRIRLDPAAPDPAKPFPEHKPRTYHTTSYLPWSEDGYGGS